jgi:DNA-binding transcriptional LysR family regulator
MLRYLDEVARCGSIRRAAATLNVASSAINRQIIAFEQELGTPIFERLPRRLRLTAAGEILIAHVRQTLKEFHASVERIETLKEHHQAAASIATVGGLAGDLLAEALAEFRLARPFSRLTIDVLLAHRIVEAVAAGDYDLGFAFDLPSSPSVTIATSLTSRVGAVMLPSHPLAASSVLRLGVLRGFPLILPKAGVMIRDQFDAACSRARLTLEPVIESNSFEFLKNVALRDQGIALLNEIDVDHAHQRGMVAFVPIAELNGLTQTLSLIHRSRGTLAPLPGFVAEWLSDLLRRKSAGRK